MAALVGAEMLRCAQHDLPGFRWTVQVDRTSCARVKRAGRPFPHFLVRIRALETFVF